MRILMTGVNHNITPEFLEPLNRYVCYNCLSDIRYSEPFGWEHTKEVNGL